MNKIVVIIAVVLVVLVGGYFLFKKIYYVAPFKTVPLTPPVATSSEGTLSGGEFSPEAASEVKEVTVAGTKFSFSPSSITVKAGQKVKITFQNQGGAPHNLVVEGLGISTKTISGGKTDTIEFTAPSSGTFTFFCSVPGHRAAGMEGILKVE